MPHRSRWHCVRTMEVENVEITPPGFGGIADVVCDTDEGRE